MSQQFTRLAFTSRRPLSSEVFVKRNALSQLDALGLLDGINPNSQHLLLTDKNVEKLYLRSVLQCLERADLRVRTLVISPAESSKTLHVYADLVRRALDSHFDKYSVVFSLGGGVVNNLAGFLASTLYRGIGLVHFPTSLLAQVDAAIDFKQAVNFDHGKNLLGSYYPASKIVVDPSVLLTLDRRLIRDGLAESVKHALCQDSDFLSFIAAHSDQITQLTFLERVVHKSVELKLAVMGEDLDADYDEALKQYGHAIGHAIEHLSEGDIYHGEAIAIGMCVSAEISESLGLCDSELVEAHYQVFESLNLPVVVPPQFSHTDLWEKVRYDKHFVGGHLCMGLLRTRGVMAKTPSDSFTHSVDKEVLLAAIEKNRGRNLN